uniref:Immunoglobulin superfamily DCC subclass member 3 n=1 Tax=Chelonoidis abingdonii TaxID=106734 RepID=A0A8C0G5A1_CHEAB
MGTSSRAGHVGQASQADGPWGPLPGKGRAGDIVPARSTMEAAFTPSDLPHCSLPSALPGWAWPPPGPPAPRLGCPLELAFLLETADVIPVREQPLVLHCWVEGQRPITITWHKDGAMLGSDSHTAMLANGSLHIESFRHRSGAGATNQTSVGEYSCTAQNRNGLLVSRKACVQLASESRTGPARGATCPRPACTSLGLSPCPGLWLRSLTLTLPHRFTLLPAGILHITGVRRADVGAYRCVASNIANSHCRRSGGAPKLYKEPMILSGPQNLTIMVHQTAILECIATGNPWPIVSWSRLDGRSIGVEGIQVLGTSNLMISDVSMKHTGVYVCAANRPGTCVRRTAQGILMVQAPPEFVLWPQLVSKPLGSSASFTCMAQGVPEPHLVWLKNGKILTADPSPSLSGPPSTLLLQGLAAGDEAIYQCIAENSAGTNQASAHLAVTLAQELPSSPGGVQATALSTTSIQGSWQEPPPEVTEGLIGYVLHVRRAGVSSPLQEAVSKTTFQHLVTSLAPATTYHIRLHAYSPLGASQDSAPVLATTMGSSKRPPSAGEPALPPCPSQTPGGAGLQGGGSGAHGGLTGRRRGGRPHRHGLHHLLPPLPHVWLLQVVRPLGCRSRPASPASQAGGRAGVLARWRSAPHALPVCPRHQPAPLQHPPLAPPSPSHGA